MEIGMVSTSFLDSPHLVTWPLQCSYISCIKSTLAAAFRQFGLSRVPTSCKWSSNDINRLVSRLIKFILPSLVHTRNVAPLTSPSLPLINYIFLPFIPRCNIIIFYKYHVIKYQFFSTNFSPSVIVHLLLSKFTKIYSFKLFPQIIN